MENKEAAARIKINKLLEAAGWRFFAEGSAPANICLEPSVTLKSSDLDALGGNFEKTRKGSIDFLLLDAKGFPFIVLEAKSEDKKPLIGKAVRDGNDRFLFEMATGTGKTLTAAAVIKLFLRSGNARRVLFKDYVSLNQFAA
ncbi:MAG: type I restriction enzyme R subunit [Elusimicrobia bacterium]|nr:MAG: type I restriction enzyme R subunit [Elusimicrobiota bacterium]KAF0158201.1 MAG: type I restriction enzyme R subunit [Elusimicrobiota bacterium]